MNHSGSDTGTHTSQGKERVGSEVGKYQDLKGSGFLGSVLLTFDVIVSQKRMGTQLRHVRLWAVESTH